MCPRYIDDAQEVDFIRKTAVIDREVHRLNGDIAGLQETRLPDAGSVREDNYTFFWQGKSQDEPRLHGVGLAVKNALLDCTVPPCGGTERIIDLKICSSSGTVNILNVYAPTLSSSMEEKDLFYDLLSDRIAKVPSTETLYILGDFNARFESDNDIWPNCLGHHGVGKMNENGQRLLEVCYFYGLCITNTYLQLKDQDKVSWRHPRSHHWHQLDLVIARRTGLKNVLLTRSYHSADCITGHALVACTLRLTPKKCHHAKPRGHPHINTDHVDDTQRKQDFASIQKAADSGNVKAMYDGIKKAVGPTVRKTAPLKSKTGEVITDEGKQMERWVEHYLELYAAENEVSKDACDAIN
ncbi:craniofacial development protein 2-like [Schistocerca gregaria]|uniref:craniofacial development protein 2-like n=1 Tax=Schistocerca gregaria TaxID=7010 RepID=UPI00211DC091|nr:craniofacial development protein 2-like [Schistocerca gregaria]